MTEQHKLTAEDLRAVVTSLPRDVREAVQKSGQQDDRAKRLFVAGGFIRATVAREAVSDVDVLGGEYATIKQTALLLAGLRGIREPIFTKNAITIAERGRTVVQFITRWRYSDPDDLIDAFDFTVAQAVVWFELGAWRSQVSERFYSDLAAKRLHYTAPQRHEDAGGSMLRVQKFLRRGYSISPEALASVTARMLSGVRPSNLWDEGERGKARVLAGLFREVDPLFIVDGLPRSLTDEEQDADTCIEGEESSSTDVEQAE